MIQRNWRRPSSCPIRYISAIFLVLFLINMSQIQAQPATFKVVAWNILHGGNDIPNGPDNVIRILKGIDPDIVLMVETYGSGERIADSLGLNFHLVAPEGTSLDEKSINLSIMSRYPLGERIDSEYPFYLGGREILINEQRIRLFSNWFYYLPWYDEPEKQGMTAEELLAWESNGKRNEMLQKVLPYFRNYVADADSIPVILGGDMNSPSHLDWGEETKDMHNGLIVPWYTTRILEDLGFVDSFREINPDPISHPGITWNSKGKRDEHRIDYIFYTRPGLKAIESESYQAYLGEPITIKGNSIPYPSDHGIVITTFRIE